ncbi:MAG: hypothetical protein MHM6MM_005840, partial [Cercozoa sp. M6MM]
AEVTQQEVQDGDIASAVERPSTDRANWTQYEHALALSNGDSSLRHKPAPFLREMLLTAVQEGRLAPHMTSPAQLEALLQQHVPPAARHLLQL